MIQGFQRNDAERDRLRNVSVTALVVLPGAASREMSRSPSSASVGPFVVLGVIRPDVAAGGICGMCGLPYFRGRDVSGIAGRDDSRVLNHEDHGTLRGSGSMPHTFGDHEALTRCQFNSPAFQIDQEMALENEEEFVVHIVFMPVVLTLHDTQSHHGVVYLAQGPVVPSIGACGDECGRIDDFQSRILDVEMSGVREDLWVAHLSNSWRV